MLLAPRHNQHKHEHTRAHHEDDAAGVLRGEVFLRGREDTCGELATRELFVAQGAEAGERIPKTRR